MTKTANISKRRKVGNLKQYKQHISTTIIVEFMMIVDQVVLSLLPQNSHYHALKSSVPT